MTTRLHRSFRLLALAAAFVLSGCSATGALNALTARNTYSLRDGVAYGPLPRQQLDVYQPTAAAPTGRPMVVFFYGGSWRRGERAQYRFLGEALASRGIVTVVADYRLYPDVRYPDFLADSAAAVAWSLAHAAEFGADPKRVFVMGHSAGGYNAAMVAIDGRWLRPTGHAPAELAGWIGLAGPYDFLPPQEEEVRPVFLDPNYPTDAMPVQYVTAAAPPAFLAVAPKDGYVDPQINTMALRQRLQAAGVPVELQTYDGTNHMTLVGAFATPLRFLAPVLDDVAAFVDEPARRAR